MTLQQEYLLIKENLLCPRSNYYGDFSPAKLAFNANLQEFAHRVGYIAALQTSGKISAEDAYEQTETLWEELKHSKKHLAL